MNRTNAIESPKTMLAGIKEVPTCPVGAQKYAQMARRIDDVIERMVMSILSQTLLLPAGPGWAPLTHNSSPNTQ